MRQRDYATPSIAVRQDDPLAFGHLTILLVEDTKDTRVAMRLLLEEHGARVLEARDGSEALDVLAAHRPDVVLCDLRMPVMDGFEFIRELERANGRAHPPVVVISGLANKLDRERTRAAGFQGHLSKPFDVSTLVSVVCTALDQHMSH